MHRVYHTWRRCQARVIRVELSTSYPQCGIALAWLVIVIFSYSPLISLSTRVRYVCILFAKCGSSFRGSAGVLPVIAGAA